MKLLRDLADLPAAVRGGAVAIGNFDGVHRGHARIVERLLIQARQCGGPAVVFTFDPHPVRLLRPQHAPPPLTWTDRKAELLAELGVDTTIAYPTDDALLQLSPEQFFKKIVGNTLQARAMVEGTNFFFGHHRAGNIEVLRQLCAAQGTALEVVEPLMLAGAPVSSSRVRQCIAAGQIDQANQMLTHPYRIRGMVRHGAARGAKIGFPTANVDAVDTLLPGVGVYAGRCTAEGATWPAAINVGSNPTFGEQTLKVEVHLIGFHDSLYSQPLEVDFLARLRDIVQFADVDALKTQLARDVAAAEKAFQQFAHEQP
ncbi:MAG TPA: bifunctional riboflavin kinase/FAD synthetase [Pirellulales bacterium]|nr:bifunctional riboflavin kinase/FAD synthetase [Pirellulales bacterium]